jgi:hypothetical protein
MVVHDNCLTCTFAVRIYFEQCLCSVQVVIVVVPVKGDLALCRVYGYLSANSAFAFVVLFHRLDYTLGISNSIQCAKLQTFLILLLQVLESEVTEYLVYFIALLDSHN